MERGKCDCGALGASSEAAVELLRRALTVPNRAFGSDLAI